MDIGFNDAGFDIVECVEIDRRFCDTLEMNSGTGKRFPKSRVNCIDIREYNPTISKGIDFIIGGPPCQTFSAAGRRANGVLGTTDARGTLFKEYIRLLLELDPKGFLFENVYGITGAQNGDAWREITQGLASAGYKLFSRILDAADYGVPQHRERMIIVGIKEGDFHFPCPTHGPDSPDRSDYYTAGQAVDSLNLTEMELNEGINGRYGHLLNDIPPGLNYSFYTEEMKHPNPVFAWRSKFSDFLYKADPKSPVRTIKAQGGQYTGPLHWNNRRFSVSEHKRLQTFPDAYLISGNRQTQIHQIGNSVPPQMARILAIAIRHQIFKTNFGVDIQYLQECEELGFRKRKRLLTKEYQQKAKSAIAEQREQPDFAAPKSHSYFATLSDTFEFRRAADSTVSDFAIFVSWGDILKIVICDSENTDPSTDTLQFSLFVSPSSSNWVLNVKSVSVECHSTKPNAYTAAWKALEEELINNNIKADLVQLCGYYHYVPKIKCAISCYGASELVFLTNIVNGNLTRKMLPNDYLAAGMNIRPDQVLPYAQKLRCLGYEIRNSNTNPQIEANEWLIPYAFPTLTPLSVQLKKSLVE